MRTYLTTFLLLTFIACSKNNTPNSTARDIAGSVVVYDEFGTLSTDNIGVSVTLSDSNTNLNTQTIQDGKFLFSQVTYGKYTLIVSRNGYGTSKRLGIQHQQPNDSASFPLQLSPINLTQLSTTTITNFTASGTPNGGIDFSVSISPAAQPGSTPRYFTIFVGKDSLLAWNNADVMTPSFPITGSGITGNFSALPSSDFPAGSIAWMRIYGDASPNNMYYDSTVSQYIFPCLNLNTQPAISFIVK